MSAGAEEGAGPILVNLIHDSRPLPLSLRRDRRGAGLQLQCGSRQPGRGDGCALLRFENGTLGTVSASDSVVAPGAGR